MYHRACTATPTARVQAHTPLSVACTRMPGPCNTSTRQLCRGGHSWSVPIIRLPLWLVCHTNHAFCSTCAMHIWTIDADRPAGASCLDMSSAAFAVFHVVAANIILEGRCKANRPTDLFAAINIFDDTSISQVPCTFAAPRQFLSNLQTVPAVWFVQPLET